MDCKRQQYHARSITLLSCDTVGLANAASSVGSMEKIGTASEFVPGALISDVELAVPKLFNMLVGNDNKVSSEGITSSCFAKRDFRRRIATRESALAPLSQLPWLRTGSSIVTAERESRPPRGVTFRNEDRV